MKLKDNFKRSDRLSFLRARKLGLCEFVENQPHGKTIYRVNHGPGVFDFLDLYQAEEFRRDPVVALPAPPKKKDPGWKVVDHRRFPDLEIEIKLMKSPTGKRGRFIYNKTVIHNGAWDFVEDQFYTFLAAIEVGMEDDDI